MTLSHQYTDQDISDANNDAGALSRLLSNVEHPPDGNQNAANKALLDVLNKLRYEPSSQMELIDCLLQNLQQRPSSDCMSRLRFNQNSGERGQLVLDFIRKGQSRIHATSEHKNKFGSFDGRIEVVRDHDFVNFTTTVSQPIPLW